MTPPLPTREEIVRCLGSQQRPLHAREIATHTGVGETSKKRLLELLRQLSQEGTLIRRPAGRYELARKQIRQHEGWEGMLSTNPRGFGFVTAVGYEDVYVAASDMIGALHGDRVKIAIQARTRRGTEGRIEEVLERRNPRVAGVLHKTRSGAWLEPDDGRVRGPIVIEEGFKQHRHGDAAVAKITRFPTSAGENPVAELIAVLGPPGDPQTEVAKILIREQIVEEHPPEAMQEAEAMAARLARASAKDRFDLRDVPLLTIDPVDARDHDDAVWATRVDEGYKVYVSIADVAEYVTPGSALDREALRRGCTLYLPDRAVPMLPRALAADLCSLLPEQDRLCLCVIAELDKNGETRRFELVEGVQRGAAMISYGGVARSLGFSETPPRSPQAEAFKRDLKVLDEVARKLRRRRMKRGALDLDLPEPKLELDPTTGKPLSVKRRTEDPGVKRAYQVVEELMLLGNELVAQWLTKRRAPTVFRVHAKPLQESLERVGELARFLQVPLNHDDLQDPKGVARWLVSIAEHPKRAVLETALLRALKQAMYDIVNVGHFGLASEAYVHFTSPIRRYPDLLVHRSVKHLLRGGKPDDTSAHLETLRNSATQASTRERATMKVEREVVDLYRALVMQNYLGATFEGTVSALVGTGLYLTLDDPFVDVLVRFEGMGQDRYELSQDQMRIVGARSGDAITLGDRVVVVIEDVSLSRRTVYARRIPPPSALDPAGKRDDKGRHRRDSSRQDRAKGKRTRQGPAAEVPTRARKRTSVASEAAAPVRQGSRRRDARRAGS